MAASIDLNGRLELRDAAGSTVGYVLSREQLRELEAECERLRQQVVAREGLLNELTRAHERLQAERKVLIAQRDEYYQSLHAVLRDRLGEKEEEIEAEFANAEQTGIPAEQVLREIEDLCKAHASGDGDAR